MNMDHIKWTETDLINLDKQDLIKIIISMQNELKNLHQKNTSALKQKTKTEKEFDFSRFKTRHILLKFLYLGWNYDGYVVQDNTDNTIEKIIFDALIKTKLIKNREESNYNRCGRTDKGVSSFSQVISLTIRSKMKIMDGDDDDGQENHPNNDDKEDELDYVSILNRVLPNDIRVISWAPVNEEISARFDCQRRVYHYYFPRMDLDLEKMNVCCQYLIGKHDFRNLCKLDVNNGVLNYIRHIYDASIQQFDKNPSYPDSICIFRIEASAFLWHQIRFIMAILFLVGQNLESPEIIKELLDIGKNPQRPQYSMAWDLPLVLFESHYDKQKVSDWYYGKDNSIMPELRSIWSEKFIQCEIIKSMINSLSSTFQKFDDSEFIQIKRKLFGYYTKKHRKLFDRPKCDGLDEQIKKNANKKIKI